MILSYGTPHDPWERENVPEECWNKLADVEFSYPGNDREENDPSADAWGRFEPGERERIPLWMRGYDAMTANRDGNFGRLLLAIADLGIAGDTIVVFSSDHGEIFGAHGRRAKTIVYDEAARVPLLMRWPDHVPAGAVQEAPRGTVDIMPTLLGLAAAHPSLRERGGRPRVARPSRPARGIGTTGSRIGSSGGPPRSRTSEDGRWSRD